MAADLTIPHGLLPRDGRFGSGPSKVRPEQVAELAATGHTLLGTSHRRPVVRSLVRRVLDGVRDLLGVPDGYEVVLDNGGASQFWDVATLCLIEQRSQHVVMGEFSAKFATAVSRAPFLGEPSLRPAPLGSGVEVDAEGGVDAYCWPQNETSTGVALPVRRPDSVDAGALTLVDATSAAGGMPVDVTQADAYYFAPQKALASDGGLWLAVLSPAAVERAQRLRETDRWVPASLDLVTSIEQSRVDQTANTPALATLFLMASQLDWIAEQGGLAWAAGRSEQSSELLYGWALRSAYATPFVTDEERRSPVVGTIRFDEAVDATAVTDTLRRNGIVDVEPYRAAGYAGLRVGMFPAVDPADVDALTACVDWVVEHLD